MNKSFEDGLNVEKLPKKILTVIQLTAFMSFCFFDFFFFRLIKYVFELYKSS